MPFSFSCVCDLLQNLQDLPPRRPEYSIIQEWFRRHRNQFERDDFDLSALMSTLLPEKRTDRVYFIQAKSLQKIIARSLGLGRSRTIELGRWKQPGGNADLADCVEAILKATPNPASTVSVQEIDSILHACAAQCRFSAPAVRSSAKSSPVGDWQACLEDVYRRLSPRDAKWLTRLILKNFLTVILDVRTVLNSYDRLLPRILMVQDDLFAATSFLQAQRRGRPVTDPLTEDGIIGLLQPRLGVKIGRQPFFKARSIKHCFKMGSGLMSCEQKLDGEYAQIHIDLSKGTDCIQILSKSGKDSTKDREGLHDAIRSSLGLGEPDCRLKQGCILEGEMVVYSDKERKILSFDKIRKHVTRSGSRFNTEKDSQAHSWENLMIVYFDLLVLDGQSLLGLKRNDRFRALEQLVVRKEGQSDIVQREVIDFNKASAASDLRNAFAKCILSRGEGLVLKANDPYFDFSSKPVPYKFCAIKLKKEYIGNFGDVGDFAVVGAGYDAAKAKQYGIPGLPWTHFFVGCLDNKVQVQWAKCKPRFVITNVVELNQAQLDTFRTHYAFEAIPEADNDVLEFRLEKGVGDGMRPSTIFRNPPVVDIRCFSFHKHGNTGFWSLRFPMVTKIHIDRSFEDTITFAELQEMAEQERQAVPLDDSQGCKSGSRLSSEPIRESSPSSPSARRTTTPQRLLETVTESPTPPAAPSPTRLRAPRSADDRSDSSLQVGNPGHRKRKLAPPGGSSSRPQKRTRNMSQTSPPQPAAVSQNSPQTPTRSQRAPLSDITTSSQQRVNIFASSFSFSATPTQKSFEDHPISSSAAASFRSAAANSTSSPPRSTFPSSPPVPDPGPSRSAAHRGGQAKPTLPTTTTTTCGHFQHDCCFAGHSFLFAPCIAQMPYVTDMLLSSHGLVDYTMDPLDWKADVDRPPSSLPSSSPLGGDARIEGRQPGTRIALVESRWKEATRDFLARIEDAKLVQSTGEREWVRVYDWRLLETITKYEEKHARRGGTAVARGVRARAVQELFRKHWVGLA